ncbi:MAG: hypothetical protein HY907_05110 [Deltaproteobacteria bacterium]|nr:hypothetical protein [Deltaproteobacteria bacterium]
MTGAAVALAGAGLMIGVGGTVDERPGGLQPEPTGDVFDYGPGAPFFPPATVPE